MFRKTIIPKQYTDNISLAASRTDWKVDTEFRRTVLPTHFVSEPSMKSIKTDRYFDIAYRRTIVRNDWLTPDIVDFVPMSVIPPIGASIGWGRAYGLVYGRT